jgi:hypothetical protein
MILPGIFNTLKCILREMGGQDKSFLDGNIHYGTPGPGDFLCLMQSGRKRCCCIKPGCYPASHAGASGDEANFLGKCYKGMGGVHEIVKIPGFEICKIRILPYNDKI